MSVTHDVRVEMVAGKAVALDELTGPGVATLRARLDERR
jgi:hypothetical protein